jgi:transcriptional regulator with PAS, ATPase and Fis domain
MDDLLIGEAEDFLKAKQRTEQAVSLRILFQGETGVGKTPFARHSNRLMSKLTGKERPFEQINCAGLTHDQFQDVVFGHKRGAFTGAFSDKRGLVDLACGGDLFLDEIGTLPSTTQALFLTFLDSMEYYRFGDDRKRKADVRILSASNVNLRQLVKEGKFRQDLYSRIAQVEIEIPPLRERINDIPLLYRYFIRKFLGYLKPFDPRILELFTRCLWEDGNIRELRDAIEHLCVHSRNSPTIALEHLAERYQFPQLRDSLGESLKQFSPNFELLRKIGLSEYLDQLEKEILEVQLKYHAGNMESIAKNLKTSRSTLYRRMKKSGLSFSLTESKESVLGSSSTESRDFNEASNRI